MNALLETPVQIDFSDSDSLYEIVDGKKVELPPMPMLSGKVSLKIAVALSNWSDSNPGIGTVAHEDVFFMPVSGNTRRPDAAFITAATLPIEKTNNPKGDYPLAPDIAVEVASWHDKIREFETKIEEYFENGVREVWAVYPELREIRVFNGSKVIRSLKGDDVLKSNILPGFQLDLDLLFPKD